MYIYKDVFAVTDSCKHDLDVLTEEHRGGLKEFFGLLYCLKYLRGAFYNI